MNTTSYAAPRYTAQHDTPPRIRVLICDDHEVVRTGLKQFIADEPDMEVAAEAATGDEAIALIRRERFDVVILDIAMPGRSGIDTLQVIRHCRPDQPVLMFSTYPETLYALNLLRAGAQGFLSKDAAPAEMIRALRSVARGRRYLSEAGLDLMASQLDQPAQVKQAHELLSEREFQIFYKLATGQSPTAIADELHLSIKTVSTYRTRLLEKMNFKTNADLTYYAIKHGLIT
jgi:two-component system invasion response regulator UvrY